MKRFAVVLPMVLMFLGGERVFSGGPDFSLSMERTACFGTCPVYQLKIAGDGVLDYEGLQHVATMGKRTEKVSGTVVSSLMRAVNSAKFFDLQDRYENQSDGCAQTMTDNPSVIISVQMQGRSKKVTYYYGCRGGDVADDVAVLKKLATDVDRIAQTKKWVGGK